MDFNKIKNLFHTIKYLRFEQITYRVLYTIRRLFKNKEYNQQLKSNVEPIQWSNTIEKLTSYSGNLEFCFLNIRHKFEGTIDWNYNEYGKLWTYNLNYFDFLNQLAIEQSEAVLLMRDYVERLDELKDGLEPYPTSLRCINWIKYLSKKSIRDEVINKSLFNQYLRLIDNLEYHILGNHLLENGFSLLFGAYYFKNDVLYCSAKKIIEEELEEQILHDGAHFELSPMYHQIILERMLDCIFILKNNSWKDNLEFLSLLELKSIEMMSWLVEVTFKDGAIPMVNDSAFKITSDTSSLMQYGKELKILSRKVELSDCGYRKFNGDSYELFADVGQVGPSYQPGHAHADTFSFIFYSNKPIIVDPGISTYNMGEIRELERSTKYHNTVTVNDEDSSIVWAGFRVAKRAKVTIEKDNYNQLKASHDGYKAIGIKHTRSFDIDGSDILISDFINKNKKSNAHFHFHPDCKLVVDSSNNQVIVDNVAITFNGAIQIEQKPYLYAFGYNNRLQADKISVTFKNKLETKIKIKG